MQGFNMGRYIPPDAEGISTGNRLHGKHPLGARGRKAAAGAIIVRFEMPFNVWCASCPQETLIGQGVRFNAEKRQVGAYYSTPIWAFRMRHTTCGGALEIRTDPQNTAYVVSAGGRRQDRGDLADGPGPRDPLGFVHEPDDSADAGADATTATLSPADREKMRQTAFGRLEKTIMDRAEMARTTERIDALQDAAAHAWQDPYTRNQQLRSTFRAQRKEHEREAAAAQDLKDRLGLADGVELLAEAREDGLRASLVQFGSDAAVLQRSAERCALAKPLFRARPEEPAQAQTRRRGVLKSEKLAAAQKSAFASEVLGNTRIAQDPFLAERSEEGRGPGLLAGIKRKRAPDPHGESPKPARADEAPESQQAARPKTTKAVLVNYDSSGSE
ncbi:hypothetical protein BROUX41_003510 [Berkeleyomyces rouxiae]|uniref:uncharacterized protein n=1 Tax=Berkeleyomyces rouxiae TaxID=2035830 RepID=UPI003B7AC5F1